MSMFMTNLKYWVFFNKGAERGRVLEGGGGKPKGQGGFSVFKSTTGCSPLLRPSSSITVLSFRTDMSEQTE